MFFTAADINYTINLIINLFFFFKTIFCSKFVRDIFKGLVYGFVTGTADKNPPYY